MIYRHRGVRRAGWSCTNKILPAAMASVSVVVRRAPRLRPVTPLASAARRAISVDLPTFDPLIAAKVAKLRYVSDRTAGITRRRCGEGFVYCDPDGRPIRSGDALVRFKLLRIPPAWTDVWKSGPRWRRGPSKSTAERWRVGKTAPISRTVREP
jgi:hypothetical protein